jgi:hypothetical protein
MPTLFISHSKKDNPYVRELQQALADHGVTVWIDSRDLLPGGLLEPGIKKAIDNAPAFAVLVSPAALQPRWITKKIRHATKEQKPRGQGASVVMPVSLDASKLPVLEAALDARTTYGSLTRWAGGAESAVHMIPLTLGPRQSGAAADLKQGVLADRRLCGAAATPRKGMQKMIVRFKVFSPAGLSGLLEPSPLTKTFAKSGRHTGKIAGESCSFTA